MAMDDKRRVDLIKAQMHALDACSMINTALLMNDIPLQRWQSARTYLEFALKCIEQANPNPPPKQGGMEM